MKDLGLLVLITLLILSIPLTIKAQNRKLIAICRDERDLPTSWGMFDVKEVRLYEEPSGDYVLELRFYEPLTETAIEYIRIEIGIDYDSNSSTGSSPLFPNYKGVDYSINSYYMVSPTRRVTDSYIVSKGAVEEESIEKVFPYDGTLKVFMLSYAFDPRRSKLICRVHCSCVDEIRRSVAVLGLAKHHWLTIVKDPYEGFSLDLKSISIQWYGNKLGIRYEFYGSIPGEVGKGSYIDLGMPDLYVGEAHGKGYNLYFHISLLPTSSWYYEARAIPIPMINATKVEYRLKCEVHGDAITVWVELLKPKSFFEPFTIVSYWRYPYHIPVISVEIVDIIPSEGWWKP